MKKSVAKKAKKYVYINLPPMTYEEIGRIAICAHERQMTLNDYIVDVAVKDAKRVIAYHDALNEEKLKPEGIKKFPKKKTKSKASPPPPGPPPRVIREGRGPVKSND